MKADKIIKNAKIFTANKDNPLASALVVKDGKFVYVGDEAGLSAYEGEVTDLGGKFIMPGILDTHVHVTSSIGFEYNVLSFTKGNHSIDAISIPDYTLVSAAEQSVLVDENGAQPQEITFIYQRDLGAAADSNSWICPKCNKERTSNFCPECGEKRPVINQIATAKPTSTPIPINSIGIYSVVVPL